MGGYVWRSPDRLRSYRMPGVAHPHGQPSRPGCGRFCYDRREVEFNAAEDSRQSVCRQRTAPHEDVPAPSQRAFDTSNRLCPGNSATDRCRTAAGSNQPIVPRRINNQMVRRGLPLIAKSSTRGSDPTERTWRPLTAAIVPTRRGPPWSAALSMTTSVMRQRVAAACPWTAKIRCFDHPCSMGDRAA